MSMSAETNKELVRRCWEESFNQGNLALTGDLVSETYVWHGPGQELHGREAIKDLIAQFRAGFPDVQWTVEQQIADGDIVATRWTMRGTHLGNLLGIPPTGRQVTISGIVMSRIGEGRIIEEWENFDQLGMLQQLGVVPSTDAQ